MGVHLLDSMPKDLFFFFFLKVIKSKYMMKCRTERGATYMKYIWHVKGKGCTNQT